MNVKRCSVFSCLNARLCQIKKYKNPVHGFKVSALIEMKKKADGRKDFVMQSLNESRHTGTKHTFKSR